MIILIILTLAVFISWMFIKNKIVRIIIGSLLMACLMIQGILIGMNLHNHYGMKKVTEVKTHRNVYTAGETNNPANLLIAQELGKKTDDYVLIYRDNKDQKKPQAHFKPDFAKDKQVETVKKSANYQLKDVKKPEVKTTETAWEWENNFFKAVMSFGDDDHEMIHEQTTVILPKDTWVVASPDQLKKLQAKQKASGANQQQQMAMMKDMPKEQQAKMAAQMMKKMLGQ